MILASACSLAWDNINELENALRTGLVSLPYCDHLTAISLEGIQLTAEISSRGDSREYIGSDRSLRPYMNNVLPITDFVLSESYISERNKRPSITAVQAVQRDGSNIGFISAHFDLRDLPLTAKNARLFLMLAPVALLTLIQSFQSFAAIVPYQPVDCCAVVYDQFRNVQQAEGIIFLSTPVSGEKSFPP